MKGLFKRMGCAFRAVAGSGVPASAAWRRRHWIEAAVAGIREAMVATDLEGRVMFLSAWPRP